MQLPLLIRDKIDYYRYILPHKEKIKQLNQEYNENIIINDNYFYSYTCWKKTDIVISVLKFHNINYLSRIGYITFVHEENVIYRLSKYYHYSSGLNNLKGYR